MMLTKPTLDTLDQHGLRLMPINKRERLGTMRIYINNIDKTTGTIQQMVIRPKEKLNQPKERRRKRRQQVQRLRFKVKSK